MEYRIDEIGAIIFAPPKEEKEDLTNKKLEELEKRIEVLEKLVKGGE